MLTLLARAEERVDAAQRGHACYDGQGQQVPCCAWEPAPWVPPYMSLASLTLLWTVFLCGQIRKFVISATIAQWCAPPGKRLHVAPFVLLWSMRAWRVCMPSVYAV